MIATMYSTKCQKSHETFMCNPETKAIFLNSTFLVNVVIFFLRPIKIQPEMSNKDIVT